MSNKRNELINYILSLTPEQIEKLTERIDLIKKVANMTDCQATYSNRLAGKLFFSEGEGSQAP